MPETITAAPAAPVEPETALPPEGFAWINRANGRTAIQPLAISFLAEAPDGLIEQLPVTEGLTFEVRPPKSKWQR